MSEKITFAIEDTGQEAEFYVIEETRINNTNYLLVTDSDAEEDAEAYVLKDTSDAEDEYAMYEFVDDEDELSYIAKIFDEILEDIDIES